MYEGPIVPTTFVEMTINFLIKLLLQLCKKNPTGQDMQGMGMSANGYEC